MPQPGFCYKGEGRGLEHKLKLFVKKMFQFKALSKLAQLYHIIDGVLRDEATSYVAIFVIFRKAIAILTPFRSLFGRFCNHLLGQNGENLKAC